MLPTKAAYDEALATHNKVAIDFTASWCGPCKAIGPKFVALKPLYSNITFFKVDVDENSEASTAAGITAMPTFQFFHNGIKVAELVGASEDKLKERLNILDEL